MIDLSKNNKSVITNSPICTFIFAVCMLFSTLMYADAQKEKQEKIATMICLEIAETKKMESARRVRLVNEFRLNADLDLFMKGDEKLLEYFEAGLCKLVLLGTEVEYRLALDKFYEDARKQREEDRKDLLDFLFASYQEKLDGCSAVQSKKVRARTWRKDSYVHFSVVEEDNWRGNERLGRHDCYGGPRGYTTVEESHTQRILYYLVDFEDHEKSFLFSGLPTPQRDYNSYIGYMHEVKPDDPMTISRATVGFVASIFDPDKILGEGRALRKKKIKKITLIMTGDPGLMEPFNDGKKITKVVYEQN